MPRNCVEEMVNVTASMQHVKVAVASSRNEWKFGCGSEEKFKSQIRHHFFFPSKQTERCFIGCRNVFGLHFRPHAAPWWALQHAAWL